MKYFWLLTVLIVANGCTHSPQKNLGVNSNDSITASAEDTSKSPLAQMIKAKATRVDFTENELTNRVSEFVATHPRADYGDVASFANKQLKDVGFAFDLIGLDAEPQGTETLIKTIDGRYLNVGMFWEPLCGEGIASRYPVVGFKDGVWTIKYKTGTYEIRAKVLRSGEVVRLKDQKKIVEVPIPEEGFEPGGIASNGKAIFGKLPLNAATNVWWRQQMRRDPKEEPPFLVLKISSDNIEFSEREEDVDNYDDKPMRKTNEDDTYQISYPESPYLFRSTVCT